MLSWFHVRVGFWVKLWRRFDRYHLLWNSLLLDAAWSRRVWCHWLDHLVTIEKNEKDKLYSHHILWTWFFQFYCQSVYNENILYYPISEFVSSNLEDLWFNFNVFDVQNASIDISPGGKFRWTNQANAQARQYQ